MNKNKQEQINSHCLMYANLAGLDFQRWHSRNAVLSEAIKQQGE